MPVLLRMHELRRNAAPEARRLLRLLLVRLGALSAGSGATRLLRATPEAEPVLMRRIDELHREHPFAGTRMLRAMLRRVDQRRRHSAPDGGTPDTLYFRSPRHCAVSGHSSTRPRPVLILPRRTLLSTRRRWELLVGLVGVRVRGTAAAPSTSSCRRAMASSRFRS